MSPSLDPRKWGKKPNRENLEFGRTVLYAQQGKGDASVEFDRALGVNRELIHDPYLEGILEQMCWKYTAIYDDKGNITQVVPSEINYDGLSLRTLLSHLNRVSYITLKEADHLKLLARRTLIGIEMATEEQNFSMGRGNFYDSTLIMILQIIDDSIGGKKAQLLKRSARVTGVEVSERKKGEGSML